MNRRIFLLIAVYIGVILLFAYLRPEKTNWTPTFSPDDSIPFAAEILHRELSTIRPERIEIADRPAFNLLPGLEEGDRAIYFCLNPSFYPGDLDLKALLDFVEKGNSCFIGSLGITDLLLDTLNVRTEYEYLAGLNSLDWHYEDNIQLGLEHDAEKTYPAAVSSGYDWFILEDSTDTVLGRIDASHPYFVKCSFGKGNFYLHAFPYLFTNYHMLYKENHEAVSQTLAMIPEAQTWIWDKYYLIPTGGRTQTPLAILNRYASFRWAYWLSIAGMLIFILFTARRRQRIIPVLQQKRNATLDFVDTIGDLYFHRGDHLDLFKKKVAILQSQVMKKYRLEISEFSDDEARQVALRASLDYEIVRVLFAHVRYLKTKPAVDSETIFVLQRQLDTFLQRSKY